MCSFGRCSEVVEVIALPCLLFTFAASGIYDEVYHGIGSCNACREMKHRKGPKQTTERKALTHSNFLASPKSTDEHKLLDEPLQKT
eukprot:1794848-Amphidinium_carterae.1